MAYSCLWRGLILLRGGRRRAAEGYLVQLGTKPIVYTARAFAEANRDQQMGRYPLYVSFISGDARTAPPIPKWWSDYMSWHLSVGTTGDPDLVDLDIVAFKGRLPDLKAQSKGPRI